MNAMNSLLERANSQSASCVKSNSFVPHTSGNNGIVNHENYFRLITGTILEQMVNQKERLKE